GLLIGPCTHVWWHWLDLIIIVSGLVDLWMMAFGNHDGPSVLGYLRLLRLVRLARLLKLVRVFLNEDLSWAEGNKFQMFIMVVIFFNAILIGFETDFQSDSQSDCFYWVEQGLLTIFFFELLVRLRHYGCKFFYIHDDWAFNWLDFIIVASGVIDLWILSIVSFVAGLFGVEIPWVNRMWQITVTIRLARLLRVLRLVRLVREIPALYTLVTGILQAMQGISWVFVLALITLYSCALLFTRLIGHRLLLPDS
ncbi:unnamed protein product, partial [Polarella glacialis]